MRSIGRSSASPFGGGHSSSPKSVWAHAQDDFAGVRDCSRPIATDQIESMMEFSVALGRITALTLSASGK